MRRFSGFTLIEMLIVIAIIGVLSSALIPRLSSSKNRAINLATTKSIRDISNALLLYNYDKGSYPTATTCDATTKTDCSLASIQSKMTQYLSSIPTTSYTQAASRSFGSGYQVPTSNQFGYVGLGDRYILTYHIIDIRDSRKYKVVNMPDGQRWMAENLNYKTSNSDCYDNGDSTCIGYGRLYSRTEAQTVCPAGRHLPSNDEWTTMLNKVEEVYNGTQNHGGTCPTNGDRSATYGTVAGTNLKSSQAIAGIDSFGFSALLGGRKSGTDAKYKQGGPDGGIGLYRSTQKLSGTCGVMRLFTEGAGIYQQCIGALDTYLVSVRCIKD